MSRTIISRRHLRKTSQFGGALLLAITIGLALNNRYNWIPALRTAVQANQPGLYQVVEFVDGDTIRVNMNGQTETVRFIGVDTPETHDPRKAVQCFGRAAAEHTSQLIGTQPVRLEADPLSTNRDRYNRLLRYVYTANGTLLNEQLIRDGYAFYYPYFPFSKSDAFQAAQTEARTQNRGLWSSCQPTPTDGGGFTSNPAS